MTIQVFGVTSSQVRKHYFPHWSDFSATTSPTDTTVAEFITDAAGDLYAKLYAEQIPADAVFALGSGDVAYVRVAYAIRLLAAIKTMAATTAQDPELSRKWQREIDAFYVDLDNNGAVALGNSSIQTGVNEPGGPTDHIDAYGLDIGDTSEASSAAPALRKDDEL